MEEYRPETVHPPPHHLFSYFNMPGNLFDQHGNQNYEEALHGHSLRGGKFYNIPFGWIRYGLNVKNRYESSEWLLSKEWAVGYYTARWEVLKSIIETHDFTADPRVQETNNQHVYVTPMMEVLW